MNKQLILVLLGVMAVSPARAADLASALSVGKVCETSSGYIQATPGHEKEMATLVTEVNKKRASVYSEIAAKEGLDPAAVGIESAREEYAKNPGKFCR